LQFRIFKASFVVLLLADLSWGLEECELKLVFIEKKKIYTILFSTKNLFGCILHFGSTFLS
jgi:hypothetical protein